jgi:hypothetical protein
MQETYSIESNKRNRGINMPEEKPQVLLFMADKNDIRENIRSVFEDRDLVVLCAENYEQMF